jgi:hypothetical protein
MRDRGHLTLLTGIVLGEQESPRDQMAMRFFLVPYQAEEFFFPDADFFIHDEIPVFFWLWLRTDTGLPGWGRKRSVGNGYRWPVQDLVSSCQHPGFETGALFCRFQ